MASARKKKGQAAKAFCSTLAQSPTAGANINSGYCNGPGLDVFTLYSWEGAGALARGKL